MSCPHDKLTASESDLAYATEVADLGGGLTVTCDLCRARITLQTPLNVTSVKHNYPPGVVVEETDWVVEAIGKK